MRTVKITVEVIDSDTKESWRISRILTDFLFARAKFDMLGAEVKSMLNDLKELAK